MNKTLTPKDILVYYDGPQLFVGIDQVGAKYICLLSESIDTHESYLCAPISSYRLSDFNLGRVDLLEVFKTPETGELYTAVVNDNSATEIPMQPINFKDIPAEWLPDEGYIFSKEDIPNEMVIQESCARNKGVVYLGLNPPEARGNDSKIDLITLSDSVKIFQSLVKYAYKKTVSTLNADTRKACDYADNYELEAYASSHGSFKLHMQTKAPADLFGNSEIFKAMTKIDELMSAIEDPEHAFEVLKKNKGHLISSFKKLLELIINKDVPLYYEWTTPIQRKSFRKSISKETATPIYELLNRTIELEKEQKTFVGEVTKIDIVTGVWSIINEDDKKPYSGKLDPDSDVKLSGKITAGEKRYKFICEERIEEETVSGKEKQHYFLISYETVE